MDNREAVNWLINVLADIGKAEHSDLWHYEQALTEIKDMLESAQISQKGTTSDTISRQAAIDELPYLLDYDGLKGENGFVSKRLVRKMLKELPPAQPEPERTMEEFMYGQDMGNPEDGSL